MLFKLMDLIKLIKNYSCVSSNSFNVLLLLNDLFGFGGTHHSYTVFTLFKITWE